MIKLKTLFIAMIAMFTVSCENDPYDTGDGSLSKVTTTFGEACYDANGCAFKFVTDEDKVLNFSRIIGKPNEKLKDKKSRSLLYYNITDDNSTVDPYTLINVLTANVIDDDKVKDQDSDPLKVESVWISANKKYLNLSLKMKTSTPEDEKLRHKIGMIYKGDEGEISNLRLIHDNGNIPGNYTVSFYFSVPVKSITDKNPQCKTIRVNTLTHEGEKIFELSL